MKFSAILLLAASALATPIVDPNAPPAEEVTITSAVTSGNGCPSGTVQTTFSPDKTVATFGFDAFQTYIGPKTKPQDHSKNCQIHLSLKYPGGFQFSLFEATYHGYARLDAGVTGSFTSSYYFSQAATKTSISKATISGPDYLNGLIYTKADVIENASLIWSPCGANGILNINNRITLTAPSEGKAAGELANDDATVKFTQLLAFKWRKCTN
ncbi:hypothetical protein Vi05172_g3154 [Venturia inaequalis]|nr:hypothetical protein Vi05172_g3154 [Venturia inaequalis]